MAVQLLTVSAYARHRGCDEKAVRKAITENRITAITDADGRRRIDTLVPALRAALAAVPEHERDGFQLPVNVMDLLTVDVCAQLSPSAGDGDMTDDEANKMGRFWFQVAAGEIRPS